MVTTNLHHGIEELANIVLDYQHKFVNSLDSINAELLDLKTKFIKMESDLTISRNVNVNVKKLMERYWLNEQYSRRECLEISGIPESVSDDALEDKIQGVLRGIDAKVDTENVESCQRPKGKGSKERVILKLSKRKDVEKIKLSKKKIEEH